MKLKSASRTSARSSRKSKTSTVQTQILKDEDLDGDEKEVPDIEVLSAEEAALNSVDLRAPLNSDERLPVATHRIAKNPVKKEDEKKKSRKGKDEKSSKSSSKSSSSRRHRKEKDSESKKEKETPSSKGLIDLGFEVISSPNNSTSAYDLVKSPQEKKEKEEKSHSHHHSSHSSHSSHSHSSRDKKR